MALEPPFTVPQAVALIREALCNLPDARKGGNNQRYTLGDAGLSAFSVFFMQSPSFLDFQVRMQKERGRNNAATLFGVHQIPSTPQICNVLDPVAPAQLAPVFVDVVGALVAGDQLATHRTREGRLLVALDGTEYHSSTAIHCPQCSTRTLANGTTQYYHTALTPVLVAPGQAAVFPLPPEFVVPQDGQAKQDCELTAGTRWLQRWGGQLAAWRTTLLGDDLYCHQPFCERVLAQGCEFIFVCLPGSHAVLYEWVADFARTGGVSTLARTRWTGKQRLTDTYRWLNDLPLRDNDDALKVGWCELTTTNADGQVLYRNAWASSRPIDATTVVAVVAAGRSRWKIENENNNTLKTKGYHFEHNYGHGKKHLAAVLASLILLALLLHTVLELQDPHYQAVRHHLPSRRTFFEHLRALAQYLPFTSWDHLWDFMLEALQPAQPPPARQAAARRRQI
ncbi:MAG: ISNCY family transposase [Chromatiaceae bacterium]